MIGDRTYAKDEGDSVGWINFKGDEKNQGCFMSGNERVGRRGTRKLWADRLETSKKIIDRNRIIRVGRC